jgi:hypothetical protein
MTVTTTSPNREMAPAAADPPPTLTKSAMLTATARFGAHVLAERWRKPIARSRHEIPRAPGSMTNDWLTGALCRNHPGARVTGFEVIKGSSGTTTREHLRIAYNETGEAAGLPRTLFSKATPTWTSRLVTGLTGVALVESRFYTMLRPALDVGGPVAYHAAADGKSGRSIILLEDAVETRRARFGNPLELYVDRSMAASMVREMAAYHAPFWESPRLHQELTWLKTTLQFQVDLNQTIAFEKRTMIGFDRAGELIPSRLRARRSELYPALMQSLRLNVSGPMTIVHSDVHPGNWMLDDRERMGLFDWQCLERGGWALDVAYALGAGLTIEDRRAWEHELLELYLQELRERGVDAPDFATAWREYCQQVFHGLAFWLYTLGAGRLQPDMQPRDITREDCHRLATAADDHDALDQLS